MKTKENRQSRTYTKQEQFAKSIVSAIKNKEIKFGPVAKVSGNDKSGLKYTSVKNKDTGAYLTVEKITRKDSKQARAYLTLITKNGETIRTDVISGEFARKAFDAVTYEPKTSKKSMLSESDIKELEQAFNF